MVSTKNAAFTITKYVLLALFLVFALFPFYWLLITSFKTRLEIHAPVPAFIPQSLSLDNYAKAFSQARFDVYIKNSLIVTLTSVAAVLFFSILAAYAFSRFKFKGKGIIMVVFLASQMIPMITAIIPLFVLYSNLKLINTLLSLILTYTISNIPFCTLTMSAFFTRIPMSLEEAAWIDGCTRIGAVRRVVLPVMLPSIIAVGVFAFTGCWNEMFFSIMMINSDALRTIPAGLMGFVQKYDVDWGQMTAASVVTLIPVSLMFFFVQKYIVSGLTAGAVKE